MDAAEIQAVAVKSPGPYRRRHAARESGNASVEESGNVSAEGNANRSVTAPAVTIPVLSRVSSRDRFPIPDAAAMTSRK